MLLVVALDAAEAKVLDYEKVLDAVLGALASDARFLYAAERRHFGGDESGVDADDAIFQRLGHAPYTADVAAVEVGGETEFRVVGQSDCIGLVLEAEQRRHRSEGF